MAVSADIAVILRCVAAPEGAVRSLRCRSRSEAMSLLPTSSAKALLTSHWHG